MEWRDEHALLQAAMRKEFDIMQKLLTNICLEEQFILKKETRYWRSLLAERQQLQETLTKIHQDRLGIMEKIESLTQTPHAALEALLPLHDANSWEILSLRDQMAALHDRICLQLSRNASLTQAVKTATTRVALETEVEERHTQEDESA